MASPRGVKAKKIAAGKEEDLPVRKREIRLT
jgi:hypothetical protein